MLLAAFVGNAVGVSGKPREREVIDGANDSLLRAQTIGRTDDQAPEGLLPSPAVGSRIVKTAPFSFAFATEIVPLCCCMIP